MLHTFSKSPLVKKAFFLENKIYFESLIKIKQGKNIRLIVFMTFLRGWFNPSFLSIESVNTDINRRILYVILELLGQMKKTCRTSMSLW